jgi:hypothetical protein
VWVRRIFPSRSSPCLPFRSVPHPRRHPISLCIYGVFSAVSRFLETVETPRLRGWHGGCSV